MDKTIERPAAVSVAAQAQDLVKLYGGKSSTEVRALDGVSVDFAAGKFTAIMGPSGSGKSTLMHCMAALDRPTSGTVRIGDTDVTTMKDKELTRLRRDRIGFVFQAFNLLPTLTAAENIQLPKRLAGEKGQGEWYERVLDAVNLRDRLSHRPAELSGGQQQRVAVARALAGRPEIVFADEPTGNLDSMSSEELLGLMRTTVDDYGQTIVMVTHDPNTAAWSDAVIFLKDGKIVDDLARPTAEAIFDRMKLLGT